jgi:class 3 adenylate cyclase
MPLCVDAFVSTLPSAVFAMERKLAVILAADIAGYSALMEADEAGTFDRVRAGRKELFEPETVPALSDG